MFLIFIIFLFVILLKSSTFRKRAITDVDTKTLNISIDNIFKQGEISYEEELHKKAVALQKEMSFDFEAFLKNLVSYLILQNWKNIFDLTKIKHRYSPPNMLFCSNETLGEIISHM